MKNQIIADFEKKTMTGTKVHPSFRPGDRVCVHYKIQEGGEADKYRVQQFEGICIRYAKGTVDSTFTVRKMGANNVGVERVFPLHSPRIDRIDVVAPGEVRRSRLYYLRELTGKAARIRTRRIKADEITSTVDTAAAESK